MERKTDRRTVKRVIREDENFLRTKSINILDNLDDPGYICPLWHCKFPVTRDCSDCGYSL